MRRFKNGAFQLAIDNSALFCPLRLKIIIAYLHTTPTFQVMRRPGLAKIVMHKPIETKSLTRKELVSLRQETFNTIKNELDCEN